MQTRPRDDPLPSYLEGLFSNRLQSRRVPGRSHHPRGRRWPANCRVLKATAAMGLSHPRVTRDFLAAMSHSFTSLGRRLRRHGGKVGWCSGPKLMEVTRLRGPTAVRSARRWLFSHSRRPRRRRRRRPASSRRDPKATDVTRARQIGSVRASGAGFGGPRLRRLRHRQMLGPEATACVCPRALPATPTAYRGKADGGSATPTMEGDPQPASTWRPSRRCPTATRRRPGRWPAQ